MGTVCIGSFQFIDKWILKVPYVKLVMHFSKENNVVYASNVPRAVDISLLNSFEEVLQP